MPEAAWNMRSASTEPGTITKASSARTTYSDRFLAAVGLAHQQAGMDMAALPGPPCLPGTFQPAAHLG